MEEGQAVFESDHGITGIDKVSHQTESIQQEGSFYNTTVDMGSDANEKKKHKEKKENDDKNIHITNLVHFFTLVYLILIVYLCFSKPFGFDFFAWHPLLLTIGWIFLMTEGILALNKSQTFVRKLIGKNRIFFHWLFLGVGTVAIVAGYVVAYIAKEEKSKPHFKTWHAIFGLVGVIFTVPSCINGVLTLYNKEIKDFYSPKVNKFMHVLSGTLAYLFGGLSAILSVYTKWFERRTNNSYVTFVIALILISTVIIWTLIKPMRGCSKRFIKLLR